MQQSSIFMEGINLMILGMGFVFIFLIFLVYATRFMSRCILHFAPTPIPVVSKRKSAQPTQPTLQDDQLLAVLTAAVHHHQRQQLDS